MLQKAKQDKTVIVIISAIVIPVLCIIMFLTVLNHFLSSMDNLPSGELIGSYSSPDGTYTVNSYLCSGNATVDFAVRCEAVEKLTGNKRNIYWNYHCEKADIKWLNNTTVNINGQTLNILNDSYDFRRCK